jgi:hypothetical protein
MIDNGLRISLLAKQYQQQMHVFSKNERNIIHDEKVISVNLLMNLTKAMGNNNISLKLIQFSKYLRLKLLLSETSYSQFYEEPEGSLPNANIPRIDFY